MTVVDMKLVRRLSAVRVLLIAAALVKWDREQEIIYSTEIPMRRKVVAKDSMAPYLRGEPTNSRTRKDGKIVRKDWKRELGYMTFSTDKMTQSLTQDLMWKNY